MRPHLLLLVCLAATAALAAELKDPATVAQEWQVTVEQASQPAVQSTLSGQSDALTTTPLETLFSVNPPVLPTTSFHPFPDPGPLYDAPNRPYPRRQPPEVPDNAIPWLYRGSNYWLVPLGGPPASR